MANKDPAFLFYSSDFLTGISDLTMEERGQYITLLCIHHQKGRLTKKNIDVAVPNVTDDVLKKFIIDENGLYFNKRLELEAKKRSEHAEKQRQRAKDGWEKRKRLGEAMAYAAALPLEDEDVNKDDIKFSFKKELIKNGFSEKLVDEWIKVRKTAKATNTETALNAFLNEVNKRPEIDKNKVLELVVLKSWRGFKWEWWDNENKQINNGGKLPSSFGYA